MIEVILRNYLLEVLDEEVYLSYPKNAPSDFVLIDKIGSGESDHLPSSTFAFQSYSDSKYGAIVLNDKVKLAIKNSVQLTEVSGVQLNSDYNFPDLVRKKQRYQAVYDINHY